MTGNRIREFLYGNVRFRVSGGFAELFLEGCASRGVELRDIGRGPSFVRASVRERHFPLIRGAALASGMEIAEEKHSGLPHFLFRYRKRYGIPAGALLAVLLLSLLSGRVWEITVSGNEYIGTEEIADVLEELGVRPGARKKEIDVQDTVRALQNRLPRLSWAAVNILGCRVCAEVREITEKPELTDRYAFSNLVAARDGVIISADVLEGSGVIKPGSAVVRGDLLVSGVVELRNGACRFTDAKGIIKARTKTALTHEVDFLTPVLVPEKERDVYYLAFFGLKIPIGFPIRHAAKTESDYYAMSRETVFPIGIKRVRYTAEKEASGVCGEEETALAAFAGFAQKSIEQYKNAKIDRLSVRVSAGNGTAAVRAEYECIEDIGEKQPFVIERAPAKDEPEDKASP